MFAFSSFCFFTISRQEVLVFFSSYLTFCAFKSFFFSERASLVQNLALGSHSRLSLLVLRIFFFQMFQSFEDLLVKLVDLLLLFLTVDLQLSFSNYFQFFRVSVWSLCSLCQSLHMQLCNSVSCVAVRSFSQLRDEVLLCVGLICSCEPPLVVLGVLE